MNEFIKLAWRNIWRNKRRTLITAASVFFAILLALVMRSMQKGSYGHMIDSFVQNYSGYIQVHKQGYWEDQTINNSFGYSESLIQKVDSIESISTAIPRLESFALASTGGLSKGVMVVGTKPEKEKQLTNPQEKIVEGEMFRAGQKGALVAEGLAGYLNLEVGDTLVMISQGYHGRSAAGLFPVSGIFHIPNPELNKRLVYTSLSASQEFFGAYGMLSSLVINLHHSDELKQAEQALKNKLNTEDYEVMNWKEISPELVQMIQSDQASGYIMLGILYLVIGFGVFGTIMMMTNERKKEFGVMIAVGMRKTKLAAITSLEMLFIGLLGILSGIAGSLPIILYYVHNPIQLPGEMAAAMETYGIEPIMPFAWQFDYFAGQSGIVLLIFFIAILYPLYSITRIKAVSALRT